MGVELKLSHTFPDRRTAGTRMADLRVEVDAVVVVARAELGNKKNP